MIEIQCPSCQTRYRIDEAALPQDSPTFKCSRCGHVFSGDPRPGGNAAGAAPARREPIAPHRPKPQDSTQSAPLQPANKAHPAEPNQGQNENDNPLARSFGDEEAKPFENLSFDFGDDPSDTHEMGHADQEPASEDPREHWEVGETESVSEFSPPPPRPGRHAVRSRPPSRAELTSAGRTEEAPPREYVPTHKAGFFLFLFAMIVLSFAALTLVLGLAPPTSRQLLAAVPGLGTTFHSHPSLERQVALVGVQSRYQRVGGQQTALVISGRAVNQSRLPLHSIEIRVALIDSNQQELSANSVFCGDVVSARMVGQMTAHELQFFQDLPPPKNFVLQSRQSAPFLAVFLNPPEGSSGFRLTVLQVQSSTAETAPPGA